MTIRRPVPGRLLLAAALCLPLPALAQQVPQPQPPQQQPQAQPQPRPKPAPPAQPQAKTTGKEGQRPAETGESQLRGRIEQLEEQLADMRIELGTLESLARGGSAGPASQRGAPAVAAGGGVDGARLDSLETQLRALTSQLEQLSAQVRQLSQSRRGEGPASAPPGSLAAASPPAALPAAGPPPGGFGQTTVTPGARGDSTDPIGRMLGGDAPQAASAAQGLPASVPVGNPRELYETAYGYLLQQDYGAAEVAFEEFLRRYPGDRLAADAQYWLGETLYVQRRYKPAGQAFLTVIEKHKASAKVPNSLLKLAQSLDQLGQKDCGIFAELEGRHPNAPADVRVKARALKQKQGC